MKAPVSVFALGLLIAALAPKPATAATSTASISVSATVQAGCEVSPSAEAVSTATAKAPNLSSPVSMACSQEIPYEVLVVAGRQTDFATNTGRYAASGLASRSDAGAVRRAAYAGGVQDAADESDFGYRPENAEDGAAGVAETSGEAERADVIAVLVIY